MTPSIMPINVKKKYCYQKVNISHKMNAQYKIVKVCLNDVVKLKN